jgi:hypothetical protein
MKLLQSSYSVATTLFIKIATAVAGTTKEKTKDATLLFLYTFVKNIGYDVPK